MLYSHKMILRGQLIMNSYSTKLNKRITWLLVSLTFLAYLAKSFINPDNSYISLVNSLVTMINLSVLFSTNGFEKIFHNNLFKFSFAFLCSFLILLFLCNIVSAKQTDIVLNSISFFSIAGTFIQNNKNNI